MQLKQILKTENNKKSANFGKTCKTWKNLLNLPYKSKNLPARFLRKT
jgi:hypothetical protein